MEFAEIPGRIVITAVIAVAFIVVLAINLVGDTLRDASDPKSNTPRALRSAARRRLAGKRTEPVQVEVPAEVLRG